MKHIFFNILYQAEIRCNAAVKKLRLKSSKLNLSYFQNKNTESEIDW